MKRDPTWTKARIGARILLRRESGRVSVRDARLAHWIAADAGVTDRLLDQALASLCARPSAPDYHDFIRSTLAAPT